ncbi:hypothetical protein [Kribbella sp.]|uniref:hypothetical protein n=1 Tax=Kribbella sp. TaxID=1871183 RepID=UPI002D61FBBF|nr:hypothetical protein [Kribbella sp.]HZX02380.1 hypothetical protein [Kribbella sp.]
MKSLRRASAAAAAAVLLGALATVPATAATATAAPATGSAAPCKLQLESVTSRGDAPNTTVTAAAPPTAKTVAGPHLFSPGAARISSTWRWTPSNDAYVVLGAWLYQVSWGYDEMTGELYVYPNPVGGGWDKFTMFEQATYGSPAVRIARYGLRNDGVLFRWTSWKNVHQYAGFASVKTMTLISETRTYDTFLATTRGGALYTIHIPADTRLRPTVKKVRTSTWQGFETLVAERCGAQSTLLMAIDKDTGAAYLYAVGHANGAATVIKGLGKVPGTYRDPVISRWVQDDAPNRNGE